MSETMTLHEDLAALFGATYEVQLSSETIHIKPLVLRDLPLFMQWYSRADFSGGEIGAEAVEANARVLEMLTGFDMGWLNGLPDEDLRKVLEYSTAANPTLFKKGGGEEGAASMSLGVKEQQKALCVSVAQLVEAGHLLGDIQGYTLQQLEILSRAHARLAAERQISLLVAARGGHVEAKSFQQIIGQLKRDIASL